MRMLLLVLAAVLVAGCGPTEGDDGPEPSPPSATRFSPIPRSEAEATLQRWVEGLARAVMPEAAWTFEPAGTEGAYGATGCTDNSGEMTQYHTVPYSAKVPLPPGSDEQTAAAILDRAEAHLDAEGFTVSRGGHAGSYGAVNGTRDGFDIGIDLPKATRLVLAGGTTPCVK